MQRGGRKRAGALLVTFTQENCNYESSTTAGMLSVNLVPLMLSLPTAVPRYSTFVCWGAYISSGGGELIIRER